jgi:hypothetical protein
MQVPRNRQVLCPCHGSLLLQIAIDASDLNHTRAETCLYPNECKWIARFFICAELLGSILALVVRPELRGSDEAELENPFSRGVFV